MELQSQSRILRSIIVVILTLTTMVGGYRGETPAAAVALPVLAAANRGSGCTWNSPGNSSVTATVDCNVRTLTTDFWTSAPLSREQKARAKGMRIKCSDKHLFESFLSQSFLFELENLEWLSIEYCKIRKIPNPSAGPRKPAGTIWPPSLKTLVIGSHNADWLSSVGLEIGVRSFEGLGRLENLDLSFNNVWVLPPSPEFLCPIPSLRNLNLSHNHLSEVELVGGGECGGIGGSDPGLLLQTLDLSFNTIRRIGANGFSRLAKLNQLFLQNNYIEEVDDRALAGLENLRIVNLSSNRLVAIPPHLFSNSRSLHQLLLQNNSISALSQQVFAGCGELRLLDLSRNTLSSQWVKESVFSSLTSLLTLRLSFNQLSYLDPTIFKDLISLQSLHLDNNRIENISPEAFSSLTNLQSLDLSRNRMSVIDSRVLTSFCFVLRQLYLDHNRIRRMDEDGLKNCTNLQDLGLAGNILPEVPSALRSANLGLLRTLDLGENRIVGVTNESFLGLGQLYGLRLVDNRISALPPGFCDSLAKLRVLNLAQNRLSAVFPGAFAGCPEVRALRLDTNSLEEIPPALPPQLPSLLWLNVSENRIKHADFSSFPESLEWLDLSYNSLESLTGATAGSNLHEKSERTARMSDSHRNMILLRRDGGSGNVNLGQHGIQIPKFHLRVLDASHNRLTSLDPSSIPPSLETLRLNHNQLSKLAADTFTRAGRLRRIELMANEFETLSLNSLRLSSSAGNKGLPPPQLFLGANPFLCDCSMEWLTRINQLNALRQYPRFMDLDSVTCQPSSISSRSTQIPVPVSDAEFLCPYQSHCFPLCHCCEFDACDCEMSCPEGCECWHDASWGKNIVECSAANLTSIPSRIPMDATRIHLDGNVIPSLPSHSFIGKKNLRVLALNSSSIGEIRNKTFNGLKALETLRLEHNALSGLAGYEFLDLEGLRQLYLHNNQLRFIGEGTFEKLKYLQVLTLHDNLLTEFSPWESGLKAGSVGGGYLTSVTIGGNPWSCECEFIIPFRTWVIGQGGSGSVWRDFYQATCQIHPEPAEENPESDVQALLPGFPNENENNKIIRIPIISACSEENHNSHNNNQIAASSSSMGVSSSASASDSNNLPPGVLTPQINPNSDIQNSAAANVVSPVDSEIYWAVGVSCVVILLVMLGLCVLFVIFRREIQFWWTTEQKRRELSVLAGICCCSPAGGAGAGKKRRTNRNMSVLVPGSVGGGNGGTPDNDKLFDAYFLYSRRDEEMLTQKLVPELEHGGINGGNAFRLCLHYRDLYLTPNSENPWNPDMVLSACDASKRVVLVLSRVFLQGEWTNEEFRAALGLALRTPMAKKLILILLPPLSPTSLLNSAYAYPELRLALSSASVISWTDDNFWSKFRQLLPAPSAPPFHVNSISRNCHYCGTLPRNDRPYTNLDFSANTLQVPKSHQHSQQQHWPLTFRQHQGPQTGFVSLMPALPPIQFSAGGPHPNYHRQENSLSTISNTYRPLTEQNFSDSTNTIGSSSNEELDHIYSTLDSPMQSPGRNDLSLNLNLNSPKSHGSSSSGIGSGSGNLTSPSEIGPIPIGQSNNGQMYFV